MTLIWGTRPEAAQVRLKIRPYWRSAPTPSWILAPPESMKMENYVHAPADATVADIPVSAGRTVAAGEVLVRMRPARSEQED